MENRNAPVTAKRQRKRRSDALYADGAARQRAYRARRKAAREAKWREVIDGVNLDRLAAGQPSLRFRPTARFYGWLGNQAKGARKLEQDRLDAMSREEYIAYLNQAAKEPPP
jgi:hypothetical protein